MSELSSWVFSGWQPQLHRLLPAQLPQQNQAPSRSHDTLLSAHLQREQLPFGIASGIASPTARGIGHRGRFLNPGGLRRGTVYCSAMKVYTRRGDDGETSLFGGQRVPKDAARVAAYGTVDELNAAQGRAQDLGGYYKPDATRTDEAMRPSATWNAILAGKLDLIKPVMTSTVGFWVARIK